MNRYAVYYKTSRTVVRATTEHDAFQKVASIFGIEPTHAQKACRAFFLRTEHTNPATTVATNPSNMSKKNDASKGAKKPMDIGPKARAKKSTLGDRVEKAAQPTKVDRKKEPKQKAEKAMSGLDAAAMVLREAKRPMTAKEIVAEIQERKLAPKLGGKTPHATIYAAMITEISKSLEPRFERGSVKGTFQHNPAI